MQKKVIRLITFSDFDAHTSPLFFQLKLLKLLDHIKLQTLYFMHQFFIGKLPKIFYSFFIKTSDKHNVNTRFATRTTFIWFHIRSSHMIYFIYIIYTHLFHGNIWTHNWPAPNESIAPVSRGHGFKPRWSPEFFFQASLRNCIKLRS